MGLETVLPSGPIIGFENFAAYLKGKQVKIPVLETYLIFLRQR